MGHQWVPRVKPLSRRRRGVLYLPPQAQVPSSIFQDGFESGNFTAGGWSAVTVSGTGTATVTTERPRSGTYSAHLVKPRTDNALYLRKTFTATNSVIGEAWYNWRTDSGSTTTNGTGPRIFSAGNRIVDVFRQDGTNKQIWLRYHATDLTGANAQYVNTGQTSELNTWVKLSLRVDYASGANSRIRVWVNDVLRIDQGGLTLYAGNYDAFQLGSEHTDQYLDLFVDDVLVDRAPAGSVSPPSAGTNKLVSSGGRLRNKVDNSLFHGRGVNAHTNGFSFGQASFDSMQTEGMKLIRLGAVWKPIEGTRNVFNQTALNHIHTSIQRAAVANQNVILLMNINSPTWSDAPGRIPDWARGTNGPAEPVGEWNTASQFDCMVSSGEAYIRKMVQEFRDYENVVGFEFMNEPDRSTGGPVQRGTQRMLEWARQEDAGTNKLWFVATNAYSSQSAADAYNDWAAITSWTNVVLQVHTYYAPNSTANGWRTDTGIRDSGNGRYWNGNPEATGYTGDWTAGLEAHFESWRVLAEAKGVPWIVGEAGVQHAKATASERLAWATHLVNAARNKGASGILWWIYADNYSQDVWSSTNTGYVWRPEAKQLATFTATEPGGGGTPPPPASTADLTHDFEAPVGNNVAITTANSGGTGRSAFDAVSTTASQTLATDNTNWYWGTQSAKFATGATAGTSHVAWTGLAGENVIYGRAYVYMGVTPTAFAAIFRPLNSGTTRLQLGITPSGPTRGIRLLNSAASTVATTTATIPLSTWVRIEWMFNFSTGAYEVRYFQTPGSTTATETLSGTGASFGGTANDYRFGLAGLVANQAQINLDAIGLSKTGWLGPQT